MNCTAQVVMESVLETKAATILQFIRGLRGNLLVTLEEGTWAAWLYDLLRPCVTQVTVCNPRKNAWLRSGNKGDRLDAKSWLNCHVMVPCRRFTIKKTACEH
jgi:hypothetical protein